jgi:cellulose biosynthesis protein BcsQ
MKIKMHTHEFEIQSDRYGIEDFMSMIEKIAEQAGMKSGWYRLSHAVKAMGVYSQNLDLRIKKQNEEIQKLRQQLNELVNSKIEKE